MFTTKIIDKNKSTMQNIYVVKEQDHLLLAQRVPTAYEEQVVQKLRKMIEEGIFVRTTKATCASPIVPVKITNGEIRICIDYTSLNRKIEDEVYPLPLVEDLFNKLDGMSIFSILDLEGAYHQVKLSLESQEILAVNSPMGLLKPTRLMMGPKTAPALFQKAMDNILAGIPYILIYLDDSFIATKDLATHKRILEQVLQRLDAAGAKVQLKKCHLFKTEVKYLGFVVSKEGRRPDPAKVDAITRMAAPKNVSELRTFLGMINYFSSLMDMRFRAPLNKLLKKNVKWVWSNECEEALEKPKKCYHLNMTGYAAGRLERIGWPTKVNEPFNLYSKNKDKLTLDQGIILYDDRVVVPTSFREKVLKELHKSHPGSSRMRMKARLSVYRPKIDSDITKFVENCVECQENQKMPVKTCLEPWPRDTLKKTQENGEE
uniref:Reverse transcriptase domain-containing protein n=1 Tax=Panagrolaimus sp. JU765 TaxID=591449 RepID=A0AC34RCX0_9BILA